MSRCSPAPRRAAAVVALVATGVPLVATADSIVYRQTFSAPSGMGQALTGTVGWPAYYGNDNTGLTLASNSSSGATTYAMLSGGPSAQPTLPNVGTTAAPTSVNPANGFVAIGSADGANRFLLETGEYPLDPARQTPTLFAWYAGSTYAGDTQRLAVEIDGQWYASTRVDTLPGGISGGSTFANKAARFSVAYDPSAGNWDALTVSNGLKLTSDVPLSTPLPADTITNFGVVATIADASVNGTNVTDEKSFIDDFEVSATPEPTSLALLGSTGTMMLARRRRR